MIDFKELAYKYKDEAIKTLQELIRCESVLTKYNPNSEAPFGEGCKEALDYILNKGRSFGLSAKNVANYAGHIEYGNNNGESLTPHANSTSAEAAGMMYNYCTKVN